MADKSDELKQLEEEYSQTLQELSEEVAHIKTAVITFREHLQEQFNKEFDTGFGSANRGMLYAQCGTNSQAIVHLLNGIISDVDLISDLSLKQSSNETERIGQML